VHSPVADKLTIRAFEKDQEPHVRERVGIILLLGAILVPLFGLADYLLYPAHFPTFMNYRVLASIICMVLFGICRKWNLGFHSVYLGVIGFFTVGIAIIAMVVSTGGYTTPYYAGLNLVFLAFCAVLGLGIRIVLLPSVLLYLTYLAVVIYSSEVENISLFVANNMFMVTTLGIGIIASHTEFNHRLKQYLLRKELEVVKARLEGYTRNLEDTVAESEEKYRLVVNLANESIFIVQDDLIKFPNPKTEELLGYGAEELACISFLGFVLPVDQEEVREKYRQIEAGERTSGALPFRIVNKEGDTRWIDMSCVPLEWKGRAAILHMLRDITDRKRMEIELIQAQKMEAIGTLAGGVAHEFNNLLQVISGYLQLLFKRKSQDDPDIRYLSHIDRSAQRAAELTKKLLIYSRKVESRLNLLDPNHEIEQSCELLERIIPKMISIEKRLSPSVYKINADAGQLEQILMNLGVNARDAMPSGGKLVIETSNFSMDEDFCAGHLDTLPGEYVLLRVSDTGMGMDEKTMERIFDPFYTTKRPGEGTGLGLAIVYSIVKNHGGHVVCRSAKGSGTTFEVYFPVALAEPAEHPGEPLTEEGMKGVSEVILLVDDEEELLDIGKEMLEMNNYQTMTAESGEMAIELYAANRDQIDLVILDINMPGMGGFRCMDKLLEIDPELKVIVSTGYLGTEQMKQAMEAGAAGFISKPYRFTEMLKRIKEALER
jgi:two-component system, cell cycle sensor histidine kinase and response regulator CckA